MKLINDSLKLLSRQTLSKTKKKGTVQIINSRNETKDIIRGPIGIQKKTRTYCE